ncbi:hypothetical protein [Sulfurimonas sp.]|uniref:hypothetical protein n=1 Tax=Sulfurimonas sp. TaxID=2022749 RepID=UPI0035673D55
MRQIILLLLLTLGLWAKAITPNEVYAQAMLISEETHILLKYYGIKHDHEGIIKRYTHKIALKPRNVWQMTYEIALKINILRTAHNLPIIEPVNMTPVLNLNPDLVYEQTQRILTEIKIFKYRVGIKNEELKVKKYKNKTPLDVFNLLNRITASFDELNRAAFTPSYVFGETMRVYEDLNTILRYLKIKDTTIPDKRNVKATPSDSFEVAMNVLNKINKLQHSVGIDIVDFSVFRKKNIKPRDVFTITQMIIAELQTIKAYIGLKDYITPAATTYINKSPADVEQLMTWNLRKISLIDISAMRLQ